MTFSATATYYPVHAVSPINFGACQAETREEAMSILMDDIREFMRNEETNDWWDDILVHIEYANVKASYPFDYWTKHFGWSF
jgi:maltooligosyltrehalose synthase